jgi:hypothetical protein
VGDPVEGNGATTVFTDPAPPASDRIFYRIAVDL